MAKAHLLKDTDSLVVGAVAIFGRLQLETYGWMRWAEAVQVKQRFSFHDERRKDHQCLWDPGCEVKKEVSMIEFLGFSQKLEIYELES